MWETANQTFKVRATAFHETGVYLPGAYFAFQTAAVGSAEWNEFAVFRVDDPIPIARDSLRFINERVAYIFIAEGYVVTVDGGRTWSKWEPRLPLPDGQSIYWTIKELHVERDGTGAAKLWRYDEQVKDIVNLDVFTKDYGQHWDEFSSVQSITNGISPVASHITL
jgi:hypothetical protein